MSHFFERNRFGADFGASSGFNKFGGIFTQFSRALPHERPVFVIKKKKTTTVSKVSAGAAQRTQARGQASTILSEDFGDSGAGVGRGTVAFKTLSGF